MANYSTIYIDLDGNLIHYYGLDEGRSIHDTRKIVALPFSIEYYQKFTEIMKEFYTKYTPSSAVNTSIILPNELVFINSTNFPGLKTKEFTTSINAYIQSSFPNFKNLSIDQFRTVSNKQFTNICFTGCLKGLIEGVKKCLDDSKFIAKNFSFAANSTICGLNNLNKKLNGKTYLFMDIKEHNVQYVLVCKGKVVGFMDLPIGYEWLRPDKELAEDVALYHEESELLVVNAREKAKQKALSISSSNVNEVVDEEGQVDEMDIYSDDDDPNLEQSFSNTEANLENNDNKPIVIKTLPKKTARRLPKFMLREVPEDDEHKVFENFRIFQKWALDIIKNNPKITSLSPVEAIYVNIPKEYNYLFDIVNQEEEENKIKFTNAGVSNEKKDISENLNLYGGCFVKDYKQTTLFN